MKTVFVVEYSTLNDVSYPVAVFDKIGDAENFIQRRPDGPHSEIHHYEIIECIHYEDY